MLGNQNVKNIKMSFEQLTVIKGFSKSSQGVLKTARWKCGTDERVQLECAQSGGE